MVKCELLLEQPEFTFGSAVFEPKLYPTPSGEQAMQRIRAKPGEVEARRNRLNAASFRVRFATLAHASRSPLASELFELTRLARPGKDAAARVILARAFQTIADSLDRARAAPTAAFARSRAAEQLTYVGQAALALEWSNRALDVCGEDQVERARALHIRGMANLALGRFADAATDAEAAAVFSRAIDQPFYLADKPSPMAHLTICSSGTSKTSRSSRRRDWGGT